MRAAPRPAGGIGKPPSKLYEQPAKGTPLLLTSTLLQLPLVLGSQLQTIDIAIIAVFFAVVIAIGIVASKTAGKSSSEFFLGGRGMPWWLLGISMVACTFSADTPNLVTGMVRENGVAKNWAWWAFLITGMVTVFIYAKLWRRSNVMTDLEFYELRYSGKAAAFLRGFRSIYLGLFFNVLIMATVTLAAIKIGVADVRHRNHGNACVCGSIVVVIYASLGGLKGVIWADFFQYGIAMFGAVYAAIVSIGEAGRSPQPARRGGNPSLRSSGRVRCQLSMAGACARPSWRTKSRSSRTSPILQCSCRC